MLRDLAALTPPLIMGCAVLAGLAYFLRNQMRAGHTADVEAESGIPDDPENADTSDPAPTVQPGRRRV